MAKPIPRQRKHKARARTASTASTAGATDSNVSELLPEPEAAREARRQALRADLHVQPSKLSRQKQKRLDKYIDTKLKKEENQLLIKKLSHQNVDTSLLESSKTLGRGKVTRRETLSKALRAKRAGIGQEHDDEILFERRSISSSPTNVPIASEAAVQVAGVGDKQKPQNKSAAGFGAGLKRPLDFDGTGIPVIQRNKRVKSVARKPALLEEPIEDDWEGFSSESGSESPISEQASATSGSVADSDDESDGSNATSELDDSSQARGSSEEQSEDDESKAAAVHRVSNFKAWAMSQRNEAIGHQPAAAPDLLAIKPQATATTTARLKQPVQPSLDLPKEQRPGRQAFHVAVSRSEEIEAARSGLPVVGKEQEIMETIFSNDCTIVTGATGSGKTTQVPQFLFEAGYGAPSGPTPGMIGVTQPRRVATVSMAKRVAHELGSHGDRVSHQIRFDTTVSHKSAIKFMTDGVLLREVAQDFVLSKYSAIVIDEAHERSVNTDILIGMLSRIVETRAKLSKSGDKFKPLKLIIMSATLRIADFASNSFLFRTGPPPIVEAEGKTHPVVTHFARKTHRDYIEDAMRKVGKGHRKLPPGGMLVFLTGQNEIVQMEFRLKEMFQPTEETSERRIKMRISAAETSVEDEDMEFGAAREATGDDDSDSEVSISGLASEGAEPDGLDFDVEPEETRVLQKVHVLPLYSQLPSELQTRVFEPPPDGSRLIVLATNVAETSLTIPGIRYVFDCGRAKEKCYEPATGVQSFDIDWISKASAEQRRGRAGRTGPGHCYRLYSSAVYENHFAQHTTPEIMRVPIEDVVLQLKSMGIPNTSYFPFPTPPDRQAVIKAERLLQNLGAISNDKVTEVGKQLCYYPVSPRLARMLVAAQSQNCMTHAIAQVAVLSAQEFLISESQLNIRDPAPGRDDEPWTQTDSNEATRRESRRKEYNAFHGNAARLDRQSDAIKLLTVLADYTADPTSNSLRTHARTKGLEEAQQLRQQLTTLVALHAKTPTNAKAPTPLPHPSPSHLKTLRTLLAAGFIDQVAQRADQSPTPPASSRKPSTATHVPYLPLAPLPATPGPAPADPRDAARAQYVYIHPSSVLAHTSPAALPRFLIYSHLSRAAPATATAGPAAPPPRTRMHPLAPVAADTLAAAARGTPLLGDSKPVGRIEVLARGAGGEERRRVWTVPFLRSGGEAGAREWPLPPARCVVQRRESGRGWIEEE